MRYRLTTISVIVAALVSAAVFLSLRSGDELSGERRQPDVPAEEIGLVAAITATARAGGGAVIDPTAFITPTQVRPTPTRNPVITPGGRTPETYGSYSPVITVPGEKLTPGQSLNIQVSGAAPGEEFEIVIERGIVLASSMAGEDGSVLLEATLPDNLPDGTFRLTFYGTVSGSSSVELEIASTLPRAIVSPELPAAGSSITLAAHGFEPGEGVTVNISGQSIGGAIAGSGGSFSITTMLPESLAPSGAAAESHEISMEGDFGSRATLMLAVTGPVMTGTTVTAENLAGETATRLAGDQAADENDGAMASLPGWVYAALGFGAGWLGALTVWVIRIDRRRETRMVALVRELVKQGDADGMSRSGLDRSYADDDDQAA